MKALTIRQPWASLIALGVKTIETRSWSTKYRGPVAIHAGLRRPLVSDLLPWYEAGQHCDANMGSGYWGDVWHHWGTFPLGAVVAVADLVDCLPIVANSEHLNGGFMVAAADGHVHSLTTDSHQRFHPDQLPYGDFTPGRFGWMLANVRPVEPIPWKGAQGLRHAPPELIAQVSS